MGFCITSAILTLPFLLGVDSALDSHNRSKSEETKFQADYAQYDSFADNVNPEVSFGDSHLRKSEKVNERTRRNIRRRENSATVNLRQPGNKKMQLDMSDVGSRSFSRRLKKKSSFKKKREFTEKQYENLKEVANLFLMTQEREFCWSKHCNRDWVRNYDCGEGCARSRTECDQKNWEIFVAVMDLVLFVVPGVGQAIKAGRLAMKAAAKISATALRKQLYKYTKKFFKELRTILKDSLKDWGKEKFLESAYAYQGGLDEVSLALTKESIKNEFQFDSDKDIIGMVDNFDITGVTAVVDAFYEEKCDKLEKKVPEDPEGEELPEKVQTCLHYPYPYTNPELLEEPLAFYEGCMYYKKWMDTRGYFVIYDQCLLSCDDDQPCQRGCEWMKGTSTWAKARGSTSFEDEDFAWVELDTYNPNSYPYTPIALQLYDPDNHFIRSNRHLNCHNYPSERSNSGSSLAMRAVFRMGCDAHVLNECDEVCNNENIVGVTGKNTCLNGCKFMSCDRREWKLRGCHHPYPIWPSQSGFLPLAQENIRLENCLNYPYELGLMKSKFVLGCGEFTAFDTNNIALCHAVCDKDDSGIELRKVACKRGCNFMACSDDDIWSKERGCDIDNPVYKERRGPTTNPVLESVEENIENESGMSCLGEKWVNIRGGHVRRDFHTDHDLELWNSPGSSTPRLMCWFEVFLNDVAVGRQWQRIGWNDSGDGKDPANNCHTQTFYWQRQSGYNRYMSGADYGLDYDRVYFRTIPCYNPHYRPDIPNQRGSSCLGQEWKNVIGGASPKVQNFYKHKVDLSQEEYQNNPGSDVLGDKCYYMYNLDGVNYGRQWQRLAWNDNFVDAEKPFIFRRAPHNSCTSAVDELKTYQWRKSMYGAREYDAYYYRAVTCRSVDFTHENEGGSNCHGRDWINIRGGARKDLGYWDDNEVYDIAGNDTPEVKCWDWFTAKGVQYGRKWQMIEWNDNFTDDFRDPGNSCRNTSGSSAVQSYIYYLPGSQYFGSTFDKVFIRMVPCVNCHGKWSEVEEDCTTEKGRQYFSIIQEASNGGETCQFKDGDMREINLTTCPTVDCIGSWSGWSTCTDDCNRMRYRVFSITTQASGKGRECEVTDGKEEFETCPSCNVDCIGSWSDWSECECHKSNEVGRYFSITTQKVGTGNACAASHGEYESKTCRCDKYVGKGFCTAADGTWPKRHYVSRKGLNGCKDICFGKSDCIGYTKYPGRFDSACYYYTSSGFFGDRLTYPTCTARWGGIFATCGNTYVGRWYWNNSISSCNYLVQRFKIWGACRKKKIKKTTTNGWYRGMLCYSVSGSI